MSVATAVRTCSKCHEQKPLPAFSPDRRSRDGRHSQCRECKREAAALRLATHGDHVRQLARQDYARHAEERKAYQRAYRRANRPKLRAYFKNYRQAERARIGRLQRRWNEANPEKRRAHSALWSAIRAGRVARRAICDECQSAHHIEAHHDDYAQPLIVRWLCALCHEEADRARRLRESEAA